MLIRPFRFNLLFSHGLSFALATTLIYSFQPTLLKATLSAGASVMDLFTWRILIGMLLFWLSSRRSIRTSEALPPKALLACLSISLLFIIAMTAFTLSLTHIDVAIASLIFALFPLATILILALLGEALTARKLLRLVVGFIGIYYIIGQGSNIHLLGVVLAVVSCLAYAVQLIITQRSLSRYKAETVMLYFMPMIAIILAIYGIVTGNLRADFGLLAWLLIILQGVMTSFFAQILSFNAVKTIGSGQMALLYPLELLLSIAWSSFFLAERISSSQFLGGGLILLSLLLALNLPKTLRRRKLGYL